MGSWEARGVIRFFPPGRRVLNRIGLRVEAGETVRVLGPSGAGKTLLAETLTGQALPEEGQVFLEGTELSALPEGKRRALRRQRLGILGREAGFFPWLTVEENTALGLLLSGMGRKAALGRAREALERFGARQAAGRAPGVLTPGGACRAQLARVSLGEPGFLLADSFPWGLPWEEEQEIWGLLKGLQDSLHAGLLHLAGQAGGCGPADRTLRLEQGRLMEVTGEGDGQMKERDGAV